MPSNALPDVPRHLRRFVVAQDGAQYNAVDQAVWRFVLLQMHARLAESAHPVYRDGLGATGISVDRIPDIAEMNDKLGRFGWGAVCVDGFIPPRAFQEFQACGILPIAAEIRTREHLPYTPAPDVIHEAAGHAPILPDPVFASYVRRIGVAGAKAFTLPDEDAVFGAVHALSEIKEDPAASTDDIARAERALKAAIAAVPEISEAALLSRLYWWTAEYGLSGTVDDYKIYGAGLLSSLGESHSCHAAAVRKLVLDESCVDVAYDITRPQPQLFITPSFEALHDVLDRVVRVCQIGAGGAIGLRRAVASRELASVGFSSGGWTTGVLADVGPQLSAPAWLAFTGPVAFAWEGSIRPQQEPLRQTWTDAEPLVVLAGRLADGHALERLTDSDLAGYRDAGTGRHRLAFERGARVEGWLERTARDRDGRLMHLELVEARLVLPGRPPRSLERYVVFAAGDVTAVQAGAVDPLFHPDTTYPSTRVPRPKSLPARDQRLVALFTGAERAAREGDPALLVRHFADLHRELVRDYPEEWLLRWNLLESLLEARDPGDDGHDAEERALVQALGAELQHLEDALDRRQPIASGLRYLRAGRAHRR